MPAYDELYVVSDLHIGGRKDAQSDFQIFRSGERLGGLIAALTGIEAEQEFRKQYPSNGAAENGTGKLLPIPDKDSRVGFVINGDFVDFLSEDPVCCLDVESAIAKLASVVERAQFKPVFVALRRLLLQPNREVIILLGNHDLPIALQHVQEWLADNLSGGDAAARGRIRFATDGAGFRCQVRGAEVLCIHGEIADDWNRVDFQGLRAIGHLYNRGQGEYPWSPSGGTQLVVNLMNEIKQTRPFVDLLKPEQEAMLPVLFALDESVRGKVGRLIKPMLKMYESSVWRDRFLGAEGAGNADEEPRDLLVRAALEMAAATATATEGSLLDEVENDMQHGVDPVDMVSRDEADQLLSKGRVLMAAGKSLFGNLFSSKSPVETLRLALVYILKTDHTFCLDEPDDPFKWVDQHVSPKIQFVIAGHTHLVRKIPCHNGWYFNSGTWAAIMGLTEAQLKDEKSFEPVCARLKNAKTVDDLFASPPLAKVHPTVVAIRRDQGVVTGQLHTAYRTTEGVRLGEWSDQGTGKGNEHA